MNSSELQDHYETLQVSPHADSETIERVFRHLAKRYHPDNRQTGNAEKFQGVLDAYQVLSNPEKRAAFDSRYDQVRAFKVKASEGATFVGPLEGDARVRHGILSALFLARRRDAQNAGVGGVFLEQLLECPQDQMEFNLWYLKEKGWIQRTDTGAFAITALGVDAVEGSNVILRADRLLPEVANAGGNGNGSHVEDPAETFLLRQSPGQDESFHSNETE